MGQQIHKKSSLQIIRTRVSNGIEYYLKYIFRF